MKTFLPVDPIPLETLLADPHGVIERMAHNSGWLYDKPKGYRAWSENEAKEWCMEELEALYDFIRDESQWTWRKRNISIDLLKIAPILTRERKNTKECEKNAQSALMFSYDVV